MTCLYETTAGRGDCNGDSISTEEVDAALKNMKCGNAPGYDNIHPEFLKNLGPRARKWLAISTTNLAACLCVCVCVCKT